MSSAFLTGLCLPGESDIIQHAKDGNIPLTINLGDIIMLYVANLPKHEAEKEGQGLYEKLVKFCERGFLEPVKNETYFSTFSVNSPVDKPLMDYAHNFITHVTLIHRDEFSRFLAERNQPLPKECLLSKWWTVSEPQAEAVGDGGTGNHAGTETKQKALTKLKKQQAAILEVITQKQFKPMAIPDGEKGTIELICELDLDYSYLFKASTAFDRAWKKGIGKLWQMEHHKSYAHRGNN